MSTMWSKPLQVFANRIAEVILERARFFQEPENILLIENQASSMKGLVAQAYPNANLHTIVYAEGIGQVPEWDTLQGPVDMVLANVSLEDRMRAMAQVSQVAKHIKPGCPWIFSTLAKTSKILDKHGQHAEILDLLPDMHPDLSELSAFFLQFGFRDLVLERYPIVCRFPDSQSLEHDLREMYHAMYQDQEKAVKHIEQFLAQTDHRLGDSKNVDLQFDVIIAVILGPLIANQQEDVQAEVSIEDIKMPKGR